MEDGLVLLQRMLFAMLRLVVLILVVMEDGLVPHAHGLYKNKYIMS